MGHLDHAAFGWLTPALSYAMACAGAALGLRCTVRALEATGASRRNWLLTAASAIGTGIWTMHFIAMLGFAVTGTDIRYDVPLTLLSLLVAVLVVGAGVFAVGHGHTQGRDGRMSLLVGGLTTGLGVASMHYLGMAALRLHGTVRYDPLLVALSVAIAVVAATAALWAALNIRSPAAVGVASLVMGAAVSSMHYTGMLAVTVEVQPSPDPLPGATAMQFIFPLAVGLGSYLFLTSAFVALSPTAVERAAYASAGAPDTTARPGIRARSETDPPPHHPDHPDHPHHPDHPDQDEGPAVPHARHPADVSPTAQPRP
ncbi:MHYT domain-containing protein [Streptomyces sp. TRM64462]|uniref:MHYT domain-containing protein n=1 Tax=Streptomyces sp. TRM64462 TaxID=2741726 RepID=UPI0015861F32|nr:MHYT domain-containing protein [Streptomyces sp. TRM64462]